MLTLFCLAWLQAAAMPCAMATGIAGATGEGHHCPYCPPEPQAPSCHDGGGAPAGCTYPDSPQVDLRGSLAAAAVMPPVPVTPLEVRPVATAPDLRESSAPPSPPGASLAISYCRYLK